MVTDPKATSTVTTAGTGVGAAPAATAGDTGAGIAPAGYRLPAASRVGAVRLQVRDLERSLAWYGQVLGAAVLERRAGRAVLGAPGSEALIELRERPGAAPVPRTGRLGLYHFAILLPDRAALGRFLAHLAALRVPAGMSDHLVSEAIYLRDPDGLGIEVYADRPRSAWRRDGRELVMTTAPLHAAAVVEAGGGAPWQGLPEGTRMGHVHLSVGDLRRAAAFYHEGLGLDKVVLSYPGALFLSAGGYHHHLGLNTWSAGAPPAGEAEARLLEWTLRVPTPEDARAAADSLAAAGHDAVADAGDWLARDPWGTVVRISRGGAN